MGAFGTSAYESLATAREDRVAIVRLNRPHLLNRVDAVMHRELAAVFGELAETEEIRAVVLASTGQAFSAGGDLELIAECHASIANRLRITDDAKQLFLAIADMPKPMVVALHGDAIGLGATVALLGDAIVAARTARLADTHVRMGLVAGDGGCVVWPASTGALRARRYLLTGDALDAETAFHVGLVTDLVDTAEQVLPAAMALASRMAALPPLAVTGTKRALNQVLRQRADEVLDFSLAQEAITLGSADLLEAIAAFKDKRVPTFEGM
jgi:enoyl-CoA hydratase